MPKTYIKQWFNAIIKQQKALITTNDKGFSNQPDTGVSRMTAKNCTTKKRGKQPSVKAGDVFTSNQGSTAKVVEYIGNKNIIIEFDCKHKYQMRTTAFSLQTGCFKSPYHPNVCGVGYLGVGCHTENIDRKTDPTYDVWKSMIRRCYSTKSFLKHPSYIDCTVDKSWHCFQVFAEWYKSHEYYGLSYHLDKDILVKGNKVYSPETCLMIPLELNALTVNNGNCKTSYPVGVHYNESKGLYESQLSINNNLSYLGAFESIYEASQSYILAKESHVKEKAIEWKDRIDSRAFEALMAWTVY